MSWRVGDMVKNLAVPAWGRGEVRADLGGGKLRVYFEHGGERLLMDRMLVGVVGDEAAAPIVVPRAPKGTARSGAVRRSVPSRSLGEYRTVFLQQYPGGFADPEYLRRERGYKCEASKLFATSLSGTELRGLMSAKDYEQVRRRTLAALNATNLVNRFELIALNNALRTESGLEEFSAALFSVLEGDAEFERRFTDLCDALAAHGANKWPIATYFAYLKWPTEHMFLKPTPTKRIADACGVALNYRTEPNWLTYRSLLEVVARLREGLSDLRPKDMIDLQSFIWLTARSGRQE